MEDITVDIGDRCTHCKRSTAGGSGLFVNRIPSIADRKLVFAGWNEDEDGNESDITMDVSLDGYMCPDCQLLKCDKCGELTDDYVLDGTVTCGNCARKES